MTSFVRARAYTKGQKRKRPRRPAPLPPSDMPEVVRDQLTISRAVIEPENLRWFILRVAPQKEEFVVRVFDLHGIPAAIPTTPRERIRRGRLFKWLAPIAPTYVLVGFPGTDYIPWWDILKFGVVRKVICDHRDRPLQAPWRTTYERDGQIKRGGVEALLPDLDAVRIGASKYMRLWRQYEKNDLVRIESGTFTGFEGKVQNISDSEVSVLLDIFGRQTPVQLAVGDVVKAA